MKITINQPTIFQTRVIKFRIWNIDTERWNRLQTYNVQDGEVKSRFPNEQIICQFTGLTDKNGVEIYEGDIIKLDVSPYPLTGEIKWFEQYAGWGYAGAHDEWNGLEIPMRHKAVKVVGNIYQSTIIKGLLINTNKPVRIK